MRKVITYGTFDLLHKGHIALLERARALGDYLIVGVTSDQYDRSRGKINVNQSTIERVDAVRATGLADLVIIEEYEGQKIDDIKRYGAFRLLVQVLRGGVPGEDSGGEQLAAARRLRSSSEDWHRRRRGASRTLRL